MSVVLDEETTTVVLGALDFEVPCARGEHAAELFVQCRACRTGSAICRKHWREAVQRIEVFIAVTPDPQLVCTACGTKADEIEELVEVIPL